jgi:hypothetical protein
MPKLMRTCMATVALLTALGCEQDNAVMIPKHPAPPPTAQPQPLSEATQPAQLPESDPEN